MPDDVPGCDSDPEGLPAGIAKQVPGVGGAVLLSRDGLALAGHGLGTDDADRLAALAAALFSHARQTAVMFGGSDGVRQVNMESDGVMLLAASASAAAILAVLADRGTDAAALGGTMSGVINSVQPFLIAQPRIRGAVTWARGLATE
jgi:predicted regulator of Ras-like GTPase activity (Roadblock/LC7/MglB family)